MDRPKPLPPSETPGYPTLSEFTAQRRALLRGLAVGAASVGVSVLLPGCLSQRSAGPARGRGEGSDAGRDDPDNGRPQPEPDTGSPDPDTGPAEPDTGDEPPAPGGEPAPHYHEVRLPSADYFHTYLRDDAYLGFALHLRTFDEAVAQFHRDNPATGLSAASQALQGRTCADFEQPASVAEHEAALKEVLEREYEEATGNTSPLESLELLIGFCDDEVPMAGDMPEPRYPGRRPE